MHRNLRFSALAVETLAEVGHDGAPQRRLTPADLQCVFEYAACELVLVLPSVVEFVPQSSSRSRGLVAV